jgi:hypothetical protein
MPEQARAARTAKAAVDKGWSDGSVEEAKVPTKPETEYVLNKLEWMRARRILPNGLRYLWTDAFGVVLLVSLFGPKSKSVLIQKKWGAPLVCKDGFTIAKEFDLKDPDESLGAQMLRQAAEKTREIVGDGTSTSIILAHAIFADGIRNVVAGASAVDIKRGLDRASKVAVEALKAMSRPVKERKEKRR